MANNSFSYTDNFCHLGPRALLKKAKGRLYCISTTPIPFYEAFVSIINVFEKSGNVRTGAELSAHFRYSKDS